MDLVLANGSDNSVAIRLNQGAFPGCGGRQIPGDITQDGTVDISDSVSLVGYLFLDKPLTLPCGDGATLANLDLLDWNGYRALDISDVIGGLRWLFLGEKAHPLGTDCRPLAGCPLRCQ